MHMQLYFSGDRSIDRTECWRKNIYEIMEYFHHREKVRNTSLLEWHYQLLQLGADANGVEIYSHSFLHYAITHFGGIKKRNML